MADLKDRTRRHGRQGPANRDSVLFCTGLSREALKLHANRSETSV
jgi:hypothetical protein